VNTPTLTRPNPWGTLGAPATDTTIVVDMAADGPSGAGVNESTDPFDWDAIDWRVDEKRVRRLRQRIFTATRAGDWKQVRNLQKLMLRSRANTLVSVRRVSQHNSGRRTPGVDGRVALTSRARAELADSLHRRSRSAPALPVRRVHIPKKNGKRRPLGIPVLADRAQQQRVRNALEPEWEARMDARQYGFRPGRGTHDAIQRIFATLSGRRARRSWVLDADLEAAFDRLDHDHILSRLGTFPGREQIRAWLNAGVVDNNRYSPTREGTPQGGVISPLLLNITLQGIEEAVGSRTFRNGRTDPKTPVVVVYADDLVVLCHSREQAEAARERLSAWLAPKGLRLNEAKTRVVSVDNEGFDFLGYSIRRHRTADGHKVLIRPSREAMIKIRRRLKAEIRATRGHPASALIGRLNPIIRGQAAYYRNAVSKRAFNNLDTTLWQHLYKWARREHRRKGRIWVANRYFDKFNTARNDRWVFGDRKTGAYLHKYSWTPIVRHVLVDGRASPDDPTLARYWADRQRRRNQQSPPIKPSTSRALRAQNWRCPLCGDYLLFTETYPESMHEWETWFHRNRIAISRQMVTIAGPGGRTDDRHRFVHTACHRQPPRAGGGATSNGDRAPTRTA
jgi:RNA-directed DNA polymerase